MFLLLDGRKCIKNQRAALSFKFKYNFGPSILGNNAGLSVLLFFTTSIVESVFLTPKILSL